MHLSTLVTGCTAALFLSAHERAALRRPPPTDTTENTASTGVRVVLWTDNTRRMTGRNNLESSQLCFI